MNWKDFACVFGLAEAEGDDTCRFLRGVGEKVFITTYLTNILH